MPGVDRDVEVRGGGKGGSSGAGLVGGIRRVEEEPKVEGEGGGRRGSGKVVRPRSSASN